MRYNTIDDITRDILSLRAEDEQRHYVRVLRCVKRVVQQLDLHLFPNLKSVPMTIGDNLTIELDDNVEGITKIASWSFNLHRPVIIPEETTVATLAYATKVERAGLRCTCSGDPDPTKSGTSCTFHTFHNFRNREGLGEIYGLFLSEKALGSWKYHIDENVIEFAGGELVGTGAQVLVEFKPSTADSTYALVPQVFFPAIMQRVNQWLDQRANPGAAQLAKMEFVNEYAEIKKFLRPHDLQSLTDAFRQNYAPVPKR